MMVCNLPKLYSMISSRVSVMSNNRVISHRDRSYLAISICAWFHNRFIPAKKGTGGSFFLLFFCFVLFCTGVAVESSEAKPFINRLTVGILSHDVDDLWSGDRREGGWVFNLEFVFSHPAYHIFSGVLRPNLGANLHNSDDTSSLYGGFLWERSYRNGVYFVSGLDLAWHDGDIVATSADKKSLGARILFRIPLELGYRISNNHAISLLFEHKSNAYIFDPNDGMDELGLRYNYTF